MNPLQLFNPFIFLQVIDAYDLSHLLENQWFFKLIRRLKKKTTLYVFVYASIFHTMKVIFVIFHISFFRFVIGHLRR